MEKDKTAEPETKQMRLSALVTEIQAKLDEAISSISHMFDPASPHSPQAFLLENTRRLLGVAQQTMKTALAFTERLESALERPQKQNKETDPQE